MANPSENTLFTFEEYEQETLRLWDTQTYQEELLEKAGLAGIAERHMVKHVGEAMSYLTRVSVAQLTRENAHSDHPILLPAIRFTTREPSENDLSIFKPRSVHAVVASVQLEGANTVIRPFRNYTNTDVCLLLDLLDDVDSKDFINLAPTKDEILPPLPPAPPEDS